MARLAGPQPVVQLPGEHDEMIYIPLGVGVVIPPWNFPLAIMMGMTVASLVTGNVAIVKPSSETPTIGAKFAEVLLEAGFPRTSFTLLTGSGAAVGDVLVQHPKTRYISFTGSRDVGLRINELAAKTQPGQIWIKRVIAEMGGKDAIVVDADADLDKAVDGVLFSAFGYQGPQDHPRLHRGRQTGRPDGGRRRSRSCRRLLHRAHRDCRYRGSGSHLPGGNFRPRSGRR